MTNTQEQVKALVRDREHGASQLIVMALSILEQAAMEWKGNSSNELILDMKGLSASIAACRPSMIGIANLMGRFREHLEQEVDGKYVHEARERIIDVLRFMRSEFDQGAKVIAAKAAGMITQGQIIMTCSYSSNVLQAMYQAHAMGTEFSVQVVESQWRGMRYGIKMQSQLQLYGITCLIVEDKKIQEYTNRSDIVILGGDALLPDGTLINGYPSLELSQAAYYSSPPVKVWSLMDTAKICLPSHTLVMEEGFQAIPLRYLAGIITEKGMLGNLSDISHTIA